MKRARPVELSIYRDEKQAWDVHWKWSWFTRNIWMSEYWKRTEEALQPLFSLLPKLHVNSILDCSCGLGFKTIMFAKAGYEVEGSDASYMAVKNAPQLAKEHGVKIRFFRSLFEELGKTCRRKYDCVYSDYFDEIGTHEELRESAKGIYSVLKDNGKFIFCSFSPKLTKPELDDMIERIWKEQKRFIIDSPVEQDGLKVIHIKVADKNSEGILENHIYLIEENGEMRAEIASLMNPRIKWTFQDYAKVLKDVGFRKIEHTKKEQKEVFILATK